ncbi:DNA cytosine methyltransferase [Streptomyces heliomycini]|uniref:DNA (cytosine-5-)-methyltransferase n=1 Tax=Streptomyces heliomycini TaxID=284032 RepID=A0ABV5L6L2_9ACTN|nr:DNA cytosine methyltransferase [Streptomyces sp. XY152]
MSHIENAPPPPAGFRILDLFAGPGGLDVAADVLGYQVTGIEWDNDACATREAAGMDTFHGDVRKYSASLFPHAQVLTGGPPCQTFTVAGHGAGRRALDDVLGYIERLHAVVRKDEAEWEDISRTWQEITEELGEKAAKAEQIKAEKHKVDALRAVERKAIKKSLQEGGSSQDRINRVLKALRASRELAPEDVDLNDLVAQYSSLGGVLKSLKAELEELGDERTGLVLQPLWWVIERCRHPGLEPFEAVILEQVPAVMPVWEKYTEVLATLGYRTRTQLMFTEAFGVPQTRKRAVLMARLGETEIPEVTETHERYRPRTVPTRTSAEKDTQLWGPEEVAVGATPKKAWVSMETALKKARSIAPNLPDRPAFTVVSNYGTGGDPGARGERDHDAPSATITGKVSRNRLVHKDTKEDLPEECARFTFPEAGVLQTFPVAYPWSGKDQPQQIGNAVPPLLALHVLRHVLEPELSDEQARARLEQAVADLEAWQPGKRVKVREYGQWEGHPLTGK